MADEDEGETHEHALSLRTVSFDHFLTVFLDRLVGHEISPIDMSFRGFILRPFAYIAIVCTSYSWLGNPRRPVKNTQANFQTANTLSRDSSLWQPSNDGHDWLKQAVTP
ncbi:hypothetical protein [Rhodanobacter sp. BL-MT-08]